MKHTFQEQFNKLTEAYIKFKIIPYKSCACFVGTLLDGEALWQACTEYRLGEQCGKGSIRNSSYYYTALGLRFIKTTDYTPQEIADLEACFLYNIKINGGNSNNFEDPSLITQKDEEALFIAFDKTLDLLKQIHISKGEVIPEFKTFYKRKKNGLLLEN